MPALARGLDHLARGFEICGDGLLYLDVLARLRANPQRLHAEVGKGAHVHVIHVRMPANILVRIDELGAVLAGETAAGFHVDVRANRQPVTDIPVCLRVLMRDGARADHADSHMDILPQAIVPGYNVESS